jgi:hypothetical protein
MIWLFAAYFDWWGFKRPAWFRPLTRREEAILRRALNSLSLSAQIYTWKEMRTASRLEQRGIGRLQGCRYCLSCEETDRFSKVVS